ncbi:MAG: hypothetical protein ACM3VV_05520 [Deltaproteobacteria bacterium]
MLYILIAIAIAVGFWILLNTFDKLLFFSPVWTFYLPEDAFQALSRRIYLQYCWGFS